MFHPLKPSAAHEKLRIFVGDWVGEEVMPPSRWVPEEKTATGRFSMRMALDGLYLISDYEESREGEVFFRGHGVYGWDAKSERYRMTWFDTMGSALFEVPGVWEGDTLTYTSQSERGISRYVYSMSEDGEMGFRIESSSDGESWSTLLRGEYRR